MRLFIAIELPLEFKEKLNDFIKKIKNIKGIRPVHTEHIHLTILFLGERKDIGEIQEKLKSVKFKPFTLNVSGHGFFPNDERINVGWLGLTRSSELDELHKDISANLGAKSDFEEFIPHITYARMNFLSHEDKRKFLSMAEELDSWNDSFVVKDFRLFSSELTINGPIHKTIRTYN